MLKDILWLTMITLKTPIIREVSIFCNIEIYNNFSLSYIVPLRKEHEKQLKSLQSSHSTKIIGAPHFPYTGNTLLVECDTKNEDGGFSEVE